MTGTRSLVDLALKALACGFAVMPPRADGSKRPQGDLIPPDCEHPDCVRARTRANGRPAHGWVHWQHTPPTEDDLHRWYRDDGAGLGLICGRISGGLEMLEFEGRAIDESVHESYANLAAAAGLTDLVDRVWHGYSEWTPSGGIHLLYRCEHVEGNLKLARRPATPDELAVDPNDRVRVLIETRGEGGYVIVAPTAGAVHPQGGAWTAITGSLTSVATVTPAERAELHRIARLLDRMPCPDATPPPSGHDRRTTDSDRPGDEYNADPDAPRRTLDLLRQHGWQPVLERGDEVHLRRPGKHAGSPSAVLHLDGGVLYVFSTSTAFEAEQSYTPFAVYCTLEHGGDYRAAARALRPPDPGRRHDRPPPRDEDAPPGQIGNPNDDYRPLRRYDIAQLMRDGVTEPARLANWLYAGGLTALNSEPGVGKTWLALWLALAVMTDHHTDVLYLDEEGGPELVTERLLALGADPDLIDKRFIYVPFPSRRWGEDDLRALEARLTATTALAVFDSLPDFLALAGRDEDRAQQVTEWVNRVCGTLRQAGCAQLVLDHLPKPAVGDTKTKRSRYSRGSGSKLAKADAALLLEIAEEFDADTSGKLRLWKTKDRRGRLPLPTLAKPALLLDVTVTDGTLAISPAAPTATPGWDGPTECMEAVLDVLQAGESQEYSGSRLADQLKAIGHGFRASTVREAAERLALDGRISARTGQRNARYYRWRPVENTNEDPLDEDF